MNPFEGLPPPPLLPFFELCVCTYRYKSIHDFSLNGWVVGWLCRWFGWRFGVRFFCTKAVRHASDGVSIHTRHYLAVATHYSNSDDINVDLDMCVGIIV